MNLMFSSILYQIGKKLIIGQDHFGFREKHEKTEGLRDEYDFVQKFKKDERMVKAFQDERTKGLLRYVRILDWEVTEGFIESDTISLA